MANRLYGFAAQNSNLNSNLNNGTNENRDFKIDNLIVSARVVDIVLDETHPLFKEVGEWNGLGTIVYDTDLSNPPVFYQGNFAKPLYPNTKNYPLINEIVFLLNLPNTQIGDIISSTNKYYVTSVSLWNHPHHNGFPSNPNTPPSSQRVDYTQSIAGAVRRITDQSTDIFLGDTFKERSNIHPLLPFEGDVIMEGRWGNSVRFGSTVKDRPNDWSNTGSNGDPITILRNGQGDNRAEGWLPTVEDINRDNSSIYLTSTQKVPINVSSTNYNSYASNPPSNPNEYANKQILINSGRLVFNTTQDHLLLASKKSINLNAVSSVNIDTKEHIVKSDVIKLGSKDATEPILKGDALVTELQSLISQIQLLVVALQAVPQTSMAAGLVISELPRISANLELTKSRINKII
jgi:hypothetical protein